MEDRCQKCSKIWLVGFWIRGRCRPMIKNYATTPFLFSLTLFENALNANTTQGSTIIINNICKSNQSFNQLPRNHWKQKQKTITSRDQLNNKILSNCFFVLFVSKWMIKTTQVSTVVSCVCVNVLSKPFFVCLEELHNFGSFLLPSSKMIEVGGGNETFVY